MTTEQQKKMLEAIGKHNESIELLGKSFGEGMKKLDEQADNLLEKMDTIKEKLVYIFDFFNADRELVASKFMSEDEAEEYAVKTKTVFKKNMAHDKERPRNPMTDLE